MTNRTSENIQQLLNDSGLLSTQKHYKTFFASYDFSEDTILITGAAGSIGSGIANHLIHCSFKKLILIDNAESSLFFLIKELELQHIKNITFYILDVRNVESMEWLYRLHKPTLIFHTAAYKHISLMEENPYEAVKLNVFGTKILADLSINYSAKKFIFISTDKAVNPISVMGMTKLIAEKYLDTLNTETGTVFLSTRFGNIFGSNGSVVPLFIKQIESGKSITITNPEATRYFIDKKEACDLILKTALMSKPENHIITFNMGKPIKILHLAKELIKVYDSKTEIKISELKLGEKLHEAIISENEVMKPTDDKDIFLVARKYKTIPKTIDLNSLLEITSFKSPREIKSILESYI
jgi:FlaA1/EpsC-like NDP-sugar epimerase